MRNFQRIAQGVNIAPLLHAIQLHPELWDQNTLRTKHPQTAHSQVSDIWVWFNDLLGGDAGVIDDKDVVPYPAWIVLPQIRPLIFDLMRAVEGMRLGRVIITRLPPGGEITPHVDGGAPALYYSRYQIALQALPGNLFHAGNETISMQTGDVWWFDNQQLHAVVNNSIDDRIVIIVDIRQ